jgi:hypothetical protein
MSDVETVFGCSRTIAAMCPHIFDCNALIELVESGLISAFANEVSSEPSVFLQQFCNLGAAHVADRLRRQPGGADGVGLVERDFIRAPVVELGRARRGVVGDLLRVFERPAVLPDAFARRWIIR